MVKGSKEISTDNRLDIFLYLLLRDYLSAGEVEEIVQETEKIKHITEFCNGYLAEYAQQLAGRLGKRIIPPKTKEAQKLVFNETMMERMGNSDRNFRMPGEPGYDENYDIDENVPNKNIEPPKFRTVSEGLGVVKQEPKIDKSLVIMPCCRLIKEDTIGDCPDCGSTTVRKYKIFGKKIGCIQPKCPNYYKKQKKLSLVAKIYNDISRKIDKYERKGWKVNKSPYKVSYGGAAEMYR